MLTRRRIIFWALALLGSASGFQMKFDGRYVWIPSRATNTRQQATTMSASPPESEERGMVRVRFINTPEGKDVLTVAREGDNLMKVGDKAGLELPRACCTGLCGTCTSDLMDPSFTFKGESKPAGLREGYATIHACSTMSKPAGVREGYQTIRACSTMVKLPVGCEEMVVDVYRMRKKKGAKTEKADNPMERFSGDWETNFRKGSKWSGVATLSNGMALRQAKPDDGFICSTCTGTGKTPCFNCKGKGQLIMGQRSTTCYICKGEGQWYCADCQATGMISRKKV